MALSGIQFSGPILVGLNQPVDVKYGPYTTTTAALTEIPLTLRHIGLTVGIDDATDGLKEYWFKAGTADLNLVLKEADASVDLSFYRTSAAQDIIDAGKASTSHAHSELNSPDNIKQIELLNNGDLTLPNGGVISDSAVAEGSLTLTPPNAGAGQGLVIRPTVSTWSITSSGYIVYDSPITISVGQLSSGNYFGTVNYAISGNGVTVASLGRTLTGAVVFSGTGPETETITWTIPANSDITEFTLTLTSVDGQRSTDPSNENDPALYYSFEDSNGLPTNQFVTVTNNGITNSEHSHVHLISADPSTVDLYLGDDDQYVKIERDAGGVVIGNYIPAVAGTISTLPNGLEAFYKLDDLTDSSGNGNTLTNVGGVTFSSGKIGDCAIFDANGAGGKHLATSVSGGPGSGLTVSMWVKIVSTSVAGSLIQAVTGDQSGWFIGLDAGSGRLAYLAGSGTWNVADQFGSPFSDNVWYHIVKRADASGVKIYIDGAEAGSWANNTWTSAPIELGHFAYHSGSRDESWNGSIDSVGIWNRALTSGEIAELYNSGAGKETPFSTGSLAVSNQWDFKTDGTLELPAGGDITISGVSVLNGGGVQANWNSTSGPSSILNKPTLGTAAATASTDYATAAQGTTADSASQPGHTHSLTDITVSGATTGQVAAWNGTAWAPSTPEAAGVSSVAGRSGAVTLAVADVANAVGSVTTGIPPATPITNMMQITSVGYGNITPAANTLYIIVG